MIIKNPETKTYSVILADEGSALSSTIAKEGFRSKLDARNYELEVIDFSKTGSDKHNKGHIIFDEVAAAFIEEKRIRVRLSTFIGYQLITRRFILPTFTGKRLDDIKPADIRAWQNGMIKMDYSQRYLRKIDTVLSSIFEYAVRFYGMRSNPSKRVGSIGNSESKKINFWTLDEFTSFIGFIDDKRMHLVYDILYWTGLRIGELLALTPADFDPEARSLRISKSYRRYHGQDIVSPPKTSKGNRTIMIHRSLNEEIKAYLNDNRNIMNNDRMFPISSDCVRDILTRKSKKAGVKRIKVHDLRHSHASLLINMNITPLMVSERLGHEKVETTLNIYAHLYPDTQQKLVTALDEQYEKTLNPI